MNLTVSKVIGCWYGSNGQTAEVIYESAQPFGPESWEAVDLLLEPRKHYRTDIELVGGCRVELPVNEIATILSDKSGVLVLFTPSRQSDAGLIHFDPPNNAAIFNADGSLRFQLKNPFGEHGSFRAVLRNHLLDGSYELGVRACPMEYPACETVCIVDGSTDDLSQQTPRWVRD